jgi:hypothetical protein
MIIRFRVVFGKGTVKSTEDIHFIGSTIFGKESYSP